jgi:antitoxin component of MazEF toxin-antitoxin module
MKVRPAWRKRTGEQGGAIISLPISILSELGIEIGDSLSVSVEDGRIVLREVIEV